MMKVWRHGAALGALAILGLMVGAGCGSSDTPCDQALDKIQQCGISDVSLNDSGEACEQVASCQADCILAADCGDIEEAGRTLSGPSSTA
jgi:hypothetical protein